MQETENKTKNNNKKQHMIMWNTWTKRYETQNIKDNTDKVLHLNTSDNPVITVLSSEQQKQQCYSTK